MKKMGIFIVMASMLAGCMDKNSPEYRLKQYLTALKNKNFKEALSYCEQSGASNLQCALDMGTTDFGITEIRDIKCKINKTSADCTFCCMKNESDPKFRLMKTKDEWLIVGVKETCPLYDTISTDTDSLMTDSMDL
jgi:hypothetical protein